MRLQGAAKLNMNPPKPQATSEGVPRKVCALGCLHKPQRVGQHVWAAHCRMSCDTDVEVVLLPAVQVVYLPSCVTRMMGPSRGDPESEPVHDKLLSLFGKANYEVIYPEVRSCV